LEEELYLSGICLQVVNNVDVLNKKKGSPMVNLKFKSTLLPEDTFHILEFTGEEAVSRLFRFELRLVSRDPDIDFNLALDASAHLAITTQNQTRYIHGMLSEFEQHGEWQNGLYEYRAVLVPRLWMLTQSLQNQIFQTLSVPEIVEGELGEFNNKGQHPLVMAGLLAADYEVYLVNKYEEREYVVQYKESDFNFISRLMEHEGIYYFFEHDENGEKLVITDAMATEEIAGDSYVEFNTAAATARYDRNVVYKLSRSQKQIPASVLLTDHNYRRPDLPMQATGEVAAGGIGFVNEFGAHFKEAEEGQKLATIRAEEYRCGQNVFSGESNIASFSCAKLYSLARHFRQDNNQTYMITRVKHHASQEIETWDNVGSTNYHNQFDCIPSGIHYRPQRLTPKPKLYGIMNGTIDSEQDLGRADLDEQGRYKVLMPFDISGRAPGLASRRIRMAQPYGGGGSGMSFPLVKGTEVIWTCIDGDIDRPIITGTVPNPLNPSVTNTENATSNVIKTTSGITMGFHDGAGAGAGQNATGGGAGSGLAQQQPQQNINPVTNRLPGQQLHDYSYKSATQEASKSTKYHSIEQQQQQSDINDIANYQIDFSGPVNFDRSIDSGKRLDIRVPDYKNSGDTTGDETNQDSYLRLGKTAYWEFQNADLDGFGGQKIDGESDKKGDKETLDGWFDYTDGNHLSITQGKRTDVVNGGDYTRIITQGGLKTNDPSPVQLDYFRVIDGYGWRRTTAAFLSSDTYTYGDSEEFFVGYKFDGMVGMSASAYVGGNLNVSASLDVDVHVARTYTVGFENAFEVVDGDKYSFAKKDSLEASEKIEIYVEGNDVPSVSSVQVAAVAYLATVAASAAVTPSLANSDPSTYNAMMVTHLTASAVMYAAAIAKCELLKKKAKDPTKTSLDREAQIVLNYNKGSTASEVLINASIGSEEGAGSDITLSGDNTIGITMRVGKSSITIKDDSIVFECDEKTFTFEATGLTMSDGKLTITKGDIETDDGGITINGGDVKALDGEVKANTCEFSEGKMGSFKGS
jgi:type VI secretion system VgrG family protein